MNPKKKNDPTLPELIETRDQYLESHPELKEYQEKIDQILEQAGDNPQERMKALAKLMAQQLTEKLVPALNELKETLTLKVTEAELKEQEGEQASEQAKELALELDNPPQELELESFSDADENFLAWDEGNDDFETDFPDPAQKIYH